MGYDVFETAPLLQDAFIEAKNAVEPLDVVPQDVTLAGLSGSHNPVKNPDGTVANPDGKGIQASPFLS